MDFNRYNVRVSGSTLRGFLTLAALAAALVPLSAAQGGVFPGNNGPIAYTCGADVCRINPDGTGKVTLLTTGSDPSWDADEFQIAYLDTGTGISVANANGTGSSNLFAGVTSKQPSFSADGLRVAYSDGTPGDIFSIQSNTGGGKQPLTATPAADEVEPAYSPDGSKVAFASNSAGTYDIWTINLTTFALTPVTSAVGNERTPTWSPSGATIVYSSAGELFAVPSGGGGTLTDLLVQGTDPAFSPDGTKIVFINAAGNLAVMTAAAGATPVEIDSSAGVKAQPDWQSVAPPPLSGSGPPRNVSYPTISLATGDSSPVIGHFLSASVGTWDGTFPISYKYQWKRCDAADPVNGICVEIPNATFSFYTPTSTDFGKRLRVQVTATNSQGSVAQNSEVTAPVTALAPVNRATPQLVGDNVVEQTLSVSGGRWEGSTPIAFSYSWRRCNPIGDIATCVPIAGATSATYVLSVADIGFSIRLWVTGTNPAGSDFVITNHTFPVVDKQHFAPSASTPPEVAGTALPGRQLTANVGRYGGDAPIKTSFVWQRCDATGGACHAIPGAKKVVYFPTFTDIGYTLRLSVTATNGFGKLVTQSSPTEPVAATPPHVKGRRIVGTAKGEYLAGGGHDDTILGNGGNDTLLGGAGDDRIDGGRGNDILTGGSGADRLLGGAGSDTIRSVDGERDIVDCGEGNDRAIVDVFDKVTNCEVVENDSSPDASPAPAPRR